MDFERFAETMQRARFRTNIDRIVCLGRRSVVEPARGAGAIRSTTARSTLARTRDLARIYGARLPHVIAEPAMMPWTVADQSTEMSRQVTLIGKPYGGHNIDQVHIGEDK